MIRVYDDAGNVIETLEREGGCVSSSQISKYPSAQFCETLPFASRSTDLDDQIVDVHEKTTMIEVRILCIPRLDPSDNTVGTYGVCSTVGCQICYDVQRGHRRSGAFSS